jgi:hypothetical protein
MCDCLDLLISPFRKMPSRNSECTSNHFRLEIAREQRTGRYFRGRNRGVSPGISWQVHAFIHPELWAMLTIFPAEFRAVIIDADPMNSLVAGLGTDSKSVRNACKDALHALSLHGPLICCVTDGDRSRFHHVDDVRKATLTVNVVPLIQMLESNDIRRKTAAAQALQSLVLVGEYMYFCRTRTHHQADEIRQMPSLP